LDIFGADINGGPISFPSPLPTPTTQHLIQHPTISPDQQQHYLHKQPQKQKLTIDDPTVLNAVWNMPNLINSFDTLPSKMKTYLIFQLLKRSSRSSLKFINSTITPVIKRDILSSLPHELALVVIRHLDARSLCRAAVVSKSWRSIVDRDSTTWRSLIYKDGLDDCENPEPAITRPTTLSTSGKSMDNESTSPANGHCDNRDDDRDHGGSDNYCSTNDDNGDSNINNSGNDDGDDNDTNDTYKVDNSMDVENNGTSDNSSDDGDDDSMTNRGKKRPLSPISNPHKDDYRKRHMLRDNWRRGRFKRTSFPGHNNANGFGVVTCLQFDDDKIVSGVDDRMINIYETKTGKLLSILRGHEGGVWALQYIGNTLVSGSTDRTIRVWDMERGVCTHVFLGHTSTVRCLQIVMPTMVDGRLEPASPLIVTGSRDSTLRVWRLPDPSTDAPFDGNGVNPWYIHTLTGHSLSVRAITAHGNTLVSGSYDTTVNVWNLETGRLVHRMEGHTQKVYDVVIDPDRKRCISGSMDSSIRMWDYVSGQCLQVLEGHTTLVGLLGLSKSYLVSGDADGTLRTWNPENGVCQHVLSGHEEAITCFQHDEHKVISGAEGGLKLWDVKSGRLIADLITGVDRVWRTAFDNTRCVAAINK
jgi:F-box and WD-40 domain protein CDC4